MGVVDWHRSLWQRSCVVILLLLLALVASGEVNVAARLRPPRHVTPGFGAVFPPSVFVSGHITRPTLTRRAALNALLAGKREVELEASVPPHPDKEPVTLTALPHHIEGVAELQFNWFFYDEENAPDQRSVKLCSDNDCQDTQTHYYPSGNFSYRVEVKRHNVSGEWDAWAVGRSNIFVAGRIENLLLKVSKATATTNRSVHISTTAYPKEDLTGVVHYNYSFGDGAKHVAGHHASVAHVYRAPGNYTLAVQGRNAVNVVETRALITVQDAVSGGRATAPTLNGTRGVQVNLNITGVSGSE